MGKGRVVVWGTEQTGDNQSLILIIFGGEGGHIGVTFSVEREFFLSMFPPFSSCFFIYFIQAN